MNTKQAKAIPLPDFLGRLGFVPVQVRGQDVWYRSPLRPKERTPSFKIDVDKNVWFDHGAGVGGTIIDLMGEMEGSGDVSRILTRIADVMGSPARAEVYLPPTVHKPKQAPVIEAVTDIADRALEAYLGRRGIPVDLARVYLKEVAYSVGEGRYRALGFGNDAGGFEVRNAAFKGSLGTKDITTLAREGSTSAAVFEGVFDFLSVLKHYKRDRATGNVLVLNSLALMERGIERMKAMDVNAVHAYLDNDQAGRSGLAHLIDQGIWQVNDASGLYAGFKDANEYLA